MSAADRARYGFDPGWAFVDWPTARERPTMTAYEEQFLVLVAAAALATWLLVGAGVRAALGALQRAGRRQR